jgi:hypothetical protein
VEPATGGCVVVAAGAREALAPWTAKLSPVLFGCGWTTTMVLLGAGWVELDRPVSRDRNPKRDGFSALLGLAP